MSAHTRMLNGAGMSGGYLGSEDDGKTASFIIPAVSLEDVHATEEWRLVIAELLLVRNEADLLSR